MRNEQMDNRDRDEADSLKNDGEPNSSQNEVASQEAEEEDSDKSQLAVDKMGLEGEVSESIEKEYQEKIRQLEERYLRLAAEFDNFKKRNARQFEDVVKSANEELLLKILGLADNFRRALDAAKKSTEFEPLYKGTELIYQQLSDILEKFGVESIAAVGAKFDPNWHEAVLQMLSEEYPDGTVMQELQTGYKMNGKALRHSKVVVSSGKKITDDSGKQD